MAYSNNPEQNQQLNSFLSTLPYPINHPLILDGTAHRFGDGPKGREPHWYTGSVTDGRITLTVGSHKHPERYSFRFHAKASSQSLSIWKEEGRFQEKFETCAPSGTSPYLERKKIPSLFGARISPRGDLMVPMMQNGAFLGLQSIKEDGTKQFLKTTKKNGTYFELEGATDHSRVFIAEGFATAASVLMATGARTLCAFDSGNLPLVAREFHMANPGLPIIIAGDEDRYTPINPGREAAEKASGFAQMCFPVFSSLEGNPTDWNDLLIREGLDVVKEQLGQPLGQREKVMETRNKGKNERKKIDMISGLDLEKALPPGPEQFVLPGLLLGQVGILCAPGGMGKSGFALMLANQISAGGKKDLTGLGPLEGGVVSYMSLEDPDCTISQRLKEIKKDLTPEEYQGRIDNLFISHLQDFQNEMNATNLVDDIKENLKKQNITKPIRLLIIDHLSYWDHSDLNSGNECTFIIKEFNKIARSLGCAILILHHSNRAGFIKGNLKPDLSSTIGGSYKLHSLARWVAFITTIEHRDLKKKYGIDSTEEDTKDKDGIDQYKLFVIEKANYGEKKSALLKSRLDRLGLLYKEGFAISNRMEHKATSTTDQKIEIISFSKNNVDDGDSLGHSDNMDTLDSDDLDSDQLKREQEKFSMIEASNKLATLKDSEHQMMNWLIRNPAFETVDVRRRSQLTREDPLTGNVYDKDREEAAFYTDVWITGDTLRVSGPICDKDDMKLYGLLVSEYVKSHKNGNRGLGLQISLRELARLSDLNEDGRTLLKIRRQLDRLSRMSMDFNSHKGHRWQGPLITEVISIGEGGNCRLKINFSEFMMAIYKYQEYTIYNAEKAKLLKGDGFSFYLFFASHSFGEMEITIEKCKKLLGIPADFDKYEAVKKVKKAVDELITANIMDKEKTFIKNNKVHTYRIKNTKSNAA